MRGQWLLILCLRRITDHLRSRMTRVVYVQVVDVASTMQENAKCMKPARFCKSKNSKSVKDSASKFVRLEKSLTCQNCTRKFATVKGRRIHESQYCGREKAGGSRMFSCNVNNRDGVEFENDVEAFK